MKLTYNVLSQTVSLEWTPEEQVQLGDIAREKIRKAFKDMVEDVKDLIHKGESNANT